MAHVEKQQILKKASTEAKAEIEKYKQEREDEYQKAIAAVRSCLFCWGKSPHFGRSCWY